jgi:transcriptional regulator with XRE-family HTH domain
MKSGIHLYVMDRVRKRRIELGMSQAILASRLKMSVGFIGKVESDSYESHYNVKHLNDLAIILKCSPRDFLPDLPLQTD